MIGFHQQDRQIIMDAKTAADKKRAAAAVELKEAEIKLRDGIKNSQSGQMSKNNTFDFMQKVTLKYAKQLTRAQLEAEFAVYKAVAATNRIASSVKSQWKRDAGEDIEQYPVTRHVDGDIIISRVQHQNYSEAFNHRAKQDSNIAAAKNAINLVSQRVTDFKQKNKEPSVSEGLQAPYIPTGRSKP